MANPQTLANAAYQLAKELTTHYLDKHIPLPKEVKDTAVQQLHQQFPNLILEQCEQALAEGFFASR